MLDLENCHNFRTFAFDANIWDPISYFTFIYDIIVFGLARKSEILYWYTGMAYVT